MKSTISIKKVTKTATGFPGNPKKNLLLIFPKAMGLPGFIASFHTKISPISLIVFIIWSVSLAATPPEVIIRSQLFVDSKSFLCVWLRSSLIIPKSWTWHPILSRSDKRFFRTTDKFF